MDKILYYAVLCSLEDISYFHRLMNTDAGHTHRDGTHIFLIVI